MTQTESQKAFEAFRDEYYNTHCMGPGQAISFEAGVEYAEKRIKEKLLSEEMESIVRDAIAANDCRIIDSAKAALQAIVEGL